MSPTAFLTNNTNLWGAGTTTSTFAYDANGHVTTVSATGSPSRTTTYTTDSVGQVMQRVTTTSGTSNSPRQFYFYFNGHRIGEIGNDGTSNIDYKTAITADGFVQGPNGSTAGTSYADFDQNYTAIDPAAGLEGANGTYTVRAGDTLSSIAQSLWGDSSLWYMLADANGIASDGGVMAGQVLQVPAKVTNVHNNADTFKPYNAGQALGDVQPGAPKPTAKQGGCGAFGAILMAVVAIVVAIELPYVAGSIFGEGGLLGAGVGNAVVTGIVAGTVSQTFGLATGITNKFDWKGVALGAISGGVFQGLGTLPGAFGRFLNGGSWLNVAAKGMLSSVITQGIGVATGLQDQFDWAGVAGAGVGAAFGSYVGRNANFGSKFANALATNTAAGLANAATRSLINGTDFGDNIMAALPDVIGQTVGGLVADGISRRGLIDDIAKQGGISRHDAKQMLREAEAGGLDRAGGRPLSETQLQERRARFDKYEAGAIAAGNADNPGFLQFKRVYEAALMAGDIYYNKSIPGVTGDFVRQEGGAVSDVTGGALTAAMLVDAKSGYYAGLYKNAKTGELVYVNRGTDDLLDAGTDKRQAFGLPDPQYQRAIDNAGRLSKADIAVTYVGHSLGGGLATAQAVVSGRSAIVFNPAAVHPNTVGGAAILARQNSLVTNITVNGEFVSYWQDKPGGIPSAGGRRVTLDPANLVRPRGFYQSVPVSSNFNPLDNHSINTVLDSIFYRYESGKGF